MSRVVRWIHEGGLSSNTDTERQLIVDRFGLRPVVATLSTEPGELHFLLSENGPSLDISPISSGRETENPVLFLKILALEYDLGAARYHCKALAVEYSEIALNFQRITKISGFDESKQLVVFSGQLDPYYEFDALLSASRRGYDKIGNCVWEAFEGGGGMPRNMEEFLGSLSTKCPVALKERLKSSWFSTGVKLKDYRDCTQHFASMDLGRGIGGVFMQRLDEHWKVWARIPDKPEEKSPKKFTYRNNHDALSYGWHAVSEVNALARETLSIISAHGS